MNSIFVEKLRIEVLMLEFSFLNSDFFWGIISLIFGFIGIIFAILERKALNRIKEREREEVWIDIVNIKQIMENQEKIGRYYQKVKKNNNIDVTIDDEIISNIYTTHTRACTLLYRKFSDAVNLEKNFGLKEAEEWSRLGKISSKWQMNMILSFIKSENIDEKLSKRLDKDFSTWHQLDKNSSFLSNPDQNQESVIFKKTNN